MAFTKGTSVGKIETAIKNQRKQLWREQNYFGAALLRIIEKLGPIAVSSQVRDLDQLVSIKPRSLAGRLSPSFACRRHKGQAFWNVTPKIYDHNKASNRCHWVLFSDGQLEKVTYTIHYKRVLFENREVCLVELQPRSSKKIYGILVWSERLNVSTSVRKYVKSAGVVENGYLNLRRFALNSGVSEEAIQELEFSLVAPTDLQHLQSLVQRPIDQFVYLPEIPNLLRCGPIKY